MEAPQEQVDGGGHRDVVSIHGTGSMEDWEIVLFPVGVRES